MTQVNVQLFSQLPCPSVSETTKQAQLAHSVTSLCHVTFTVHNLHLIVKYVMGNHPGYFESNWLAL